MNIARSLAAAAALALVSAAPASAAIYDVVADFAATNPNGVWSYGERATLDSFAAFTSYQSACFGVAGLNCFISSSPAAGGVPVVTLNTASPFLYVNTVVEATDVLLLHPGPDRDTVVRFTAPTTADYSYAGFFQVLDLFPTGVDLYVAGVKTSFLGAAANGATLTGGGKFNFSGTVHLDAGQVFDFAVGPGSDYHFDSTGLSLQIAPAVADGPIPEPAGWALMLAGFGTAGAVLRRRRAAVTRPA